MLLLALASCSVSAGAELYKLDYSKPLKPSDENNFIELSKQMVDLGAKECTKNSSTFEYFYNETLGDTLNKFDQWVSDALFAKAKTDKIRNVYALRDGANRKTFRILIDTGLSSTYSQQIEYIYNTSTKEFFAYRFTCYTVGY